MNEPIHYDLVITGSNPNNNVKIRTDINKVEFGPESNWDELAKAFFEHIAKYGFDIRVRSYNQGYDAGYEDGQNEL